MQKYMLEMVDLSPLWTVNNRCCSFGSYSPQVVDLEYKLRPFIPDFIPAVGDIDAFLKVPRPDGVSDGIGLTVLDEPCIAQSEPALLHLQLRALAKQSSAKAVVSNLPVFHDMSVKLNSCITVLPNFAFFYILTAVKCFTGKGSNLPYYWIARSERAFFNVFITFGYNGFPINRW